MRPRPSWTAYLHALAILISLLLLAPAARGVANTGGPAVTGAVYTMSNAVSGNEIIAFDRHPDGSVTPAGTHPTGGLGTGSGLGNQGGVILSSDHRWLLAVNAGSDEISLFRVHRGELRLAATVPSGGIRPVSVAIHKDLVYVVNAGGEVGASDSIHGFRLDRSAGLLPLPGSSLPLSAAMTSPAQIGFSPDGRFLLVTEKATDSIDTFRIGQDGYASGLTVNPAPGRTPFAFAFGKRDLVFVSEVFGGDPDAGAVSSFRLLRSGQLEVLAPSVPNTETAPCWLVATRGGRYVYTTNTPSDSLSGFEVEPNGALRLLDPGGRTGEPGMGTRPLDMDLSADGRFLYTLNIGNNTLSTFRVMPNGSLVELFQTGGVPSGTNGLAVR